MAEQMTYNIQFKAQAEGLDKIIKQVSEIAGTKAIKLTDGMQKDLAKLQNRWEAFQQTLNAQLGDNDLGKDTLKSLSNEFIKITDLAKKLSLEMSSISLPAETTKEITALYDKLKDLQRQRSNARSRLRNAQSLLNEKGGASVKAEGQAFNRARGSQLSGRGNKVFTSADEVRSHIDELNAQNAVPGVSSETIAENLTLIKELTSWLDQYKAALDRVVASAKNKIQNANEDIAVNDKSIANVNTQIAQKQAEIQVTQQSNDVKSEATQITEQLVQAAQDLNNISVKQIANTENELDARSEANKQAREQERLQKQVEDQMRKLSQTSKDQTDKTNQLAQSTTKSNNVFSRAAKTVISYGTVLSMLRRVYNETLKTVTEMDEALTGMAVVTSMSREQTWNLIDSFQELATQTGKTTTEIADMATKFYQQGKSTTQVLQLTEAAAKAATIAGIDGSRSIDLLTNAMNGFQLSSSEAMEVSDKFAALAAASATDYEELAVALSKVAAQANLAGMSMDFTLGLLAKGVETTREAPETIGTALKTVISRMRELSDYEDTLSDGTDVNRVEKALSNIGVELRDSEGQFRDLEEVLTEVGGKWEDLNKNQQANVAVALAGTRQQSRLIAMMQDFDRTLELVDTSANSYGATMAQSAKYMEGLEAKTTLLTTAWQKLITTITDSKLVIGVVETLTKLVKTLTNIISSGWGGALAGVVIALSLAAVGQKAYNNQVKKDQAQQQRIQELEDLHTQTKQQAILIKNQEIAANQTIIDQINDRIAKENTEIANLKAKNQQIDAEIAKQKELKDIQNYEKELRLSTSTAKNATDNSRARHAANAQNLAQNNENVKAYLANQQAVSTNNQTIADAEKQLEIEKESKKNAEAKLAKQNEIKESLGDQLDTQKEEEKVTLESLRTKKKEQKHSAEVTLEEKKQTLEQANQLVLQAKQNLLKAQESGDQAAITQAQQDLNNALSYQQEAQVDYNNEVNKQFSDMITQSGALGTLWQSLSGVLGSLVPILSTVNALTKVGIALSNKEYRAQLRKLVAAKLNAAWQMAQSAAQTPVVGWVIAAAILAAAGIALAVSATKASKAVETSTTNTTDNLNSMQADLYNLNNSITTVSGLADEFEELNSKIVKTADDTKRLAEIIQEVNDAVGFTLITDDMTDDQAEKLIKGYEADLRKQKSEKVTESANTFASGLKDLAKADVEQKNFWSNFGIIASGGLLGAFGLAGTITAVVQRNEAAINENLNSEEFRKTYIKSLGDAGKNTIRNIAINQLDGLAEASAETQEFIQNAFYDQAWKLIDTKSGTINTQSFAQQFGDFKAFIKDLDAAGDNGSFTKYVETLKQLDSATLQCLTSSNAFLASVMKLDSKGLTGLCDQLELTVDEFNELYSIMQKVGGDKTDGLLSNLVTQSGGDKIELYAKLAAEINAAANSIDESNPEQYEGYRTLSSQAVAKQKEVDDLEKAYKALDKESEEYQKAYRKYAEAQGELDDINGELLYYTDPDTWAKNAKKSARAVLLVDNAVSDYTDSLTKLKSTFDNLSKISDWGATDFSDKMDLLNDYPELLKSIESGVLDAASALEFYNSKFTENKELLEKDLRSTAAKYSDQTDLLKGLGLGSIFDGSEASYAQIQELLLNKSKVKADWGLSEENFNSLWSDISAYGQKEYLLRQMEKEGISTVMGIDFDLSGNQAKYNRASNIAAQFATDLERLSEDSEEYAAKSKEYTNALKEQLAAAQALTKEKDVESSIRALFGNISDEDYATIRKTFDLYNGELTVSSEKVEALNDDQTNLLKTQIAGLQTLAEKQKEVYDQMYEVAEQLAQNDIDNQTKTIEAQIETLEARKEAYEDYFNELDALQDEEDNAETHDSLVKQIAALSGALDGQSKSKIKELQAELEDLKEEELQNQRERQQDAILDSIDNETEELNTQLDNLNESLNKLMEEYLSNSDLLQPSAANYATSTADTVNTKTSTPNTSASTATSQSSGAGNLTIGSMNLNLVSEDGKTINGSQLVDAIVKVLKQYGITVDTKQ